MYFYIRLGFDKVQDKLSMEILL